ncbi:monovalent cation/H(+) antiporter subunit G [Propioniciclava sp. MC1595]|uniref:monovalent cation/H(+) antiporter subunit G n=1 Tax=Propioniciclava sp. MC1595 TaxID=2760308 RepID=UPI001CB78317|nr:monovalent cation/H(+) antiporter subunit G [Propioniciclava sp. MC1595]
MIGDILDLVGAVLLLLGSLFCLAAAVGVVRFPDVLTRLHAATKPQVFGLTLILTGVALTLRTWPVAVLAAFTIGLQILTAPVSGHMLARTAYRTDQWDDQHAVMDELGDDLEAAGFTNITDEEGGSTAARHPLG